MFDSKSENRDRAVEAVESVSEARAIRVRVGVRVRVSCAFNSAWPANHSSGEITPSPSRSYLVQVAIR